MKYKKLLAYFVIYNLGSLYMSLLTFGFSGKHELVDSLVIGYMSSTVLFITLFVAFWCVNVIDN